MAFALKGKIAVGPIVETTGDEMANVIWKKVKEAIIEPYLDIKTNIFDLSKSSRMKHGKNIIFDVIKAINECNVGVICPTLPLDNINPSFLIRSSFGGTLFREPLTTNLIPPLISGWKKPIIIARHASTEGYKRKCFKVNGPGSFYLKYDGVEDMLVNEFTKGQEALCYGEFIRLDSVEAFADSCFKYSIKHKLPLYISEGTWFNDSYTCLFREIFDKKFLEYKEQFNKYDIWFDQMSIENMVILALKSEGGFVWACKNHDGHLMGHLVSSGYGPLALTINLFACNHHKTIITEPSHGTITSHYKRHIENKETSTNVMATVFTWTRALEHRAKLDKNERLEQFCYAVESACLSAVESGVFSQDIANAINRRSNAKVNASTTDEFISEIANQLKVKLVMYQTPITFEKASSPLSLAYRDYMR